MSKATSKAEKNLMKLKTFRRERKRIKVPKYDKIQEATKKLRKLK